MKSAAGALRAAGLVCAALSVGACTLNQRIEDAGRIDYKSQGRQGPGLEVPPDLATPRGDNRYTMPERSVSDRTFSGFERSRTTERPVDSSNVLPAVDGVRMERAGSQRWLVIQAPAEKVWPVLREFWQESGFIVQTESPGTGVMETDWAENRAKIPQDFVRRTLGRVIDNLYSTSERDRFRTRLETTAAGTEVYISHRGMVEVFTNRQEDTTVWQPRPSDPELEAEFLRRVMLKFGVSNEQSQAAVAATASPSGERASLINVGATQELEVAEGFDRAWRRVGLALDRGGFTVEDRDRSQGLYFVRYIDPEVEGGRVAQKPGFFARLFGSSKQRADAAQKFRIHVTGAAEQTRVTVLGGDGQPVGDVDRRTAARILALLHEQLK
ncbi:MAG: outer membrane protein assembly factor BamC [Burkholderiaceae bacterium]